MLQLFVIQAIYHSRGSMPEPGHYLGFLDQASAEAHVKTQYAGRDIKGPTPHKYVNWETLGLKEAGSRTVGMLIRQVQQGGGNHFRFDKLEDMHDA